MTITGGGGGLIRDEGANVEEGLTDLEREASQKDNGI